MKKFSILLAMILAMGVLGCQKEEVKKEPVSQTSPTTENVIDAEFRELHHLPLHYHLPRFRRPQEFQK